MLEEILAKRGYRTISATNGEEALKIVELDSEVGLVLLDHKMPTMTGLDFLKVCRTNFPHLHVVMVTADTSNQLIVEAMRYGAFDFINKPFDINKLLTIINRSFKILNNNNAQRRLLNEALEFSLTLAFRSADLSVINLRSFVQDILTTYSFADQSIIHNMMLALEEAVQNALDHGNLELKSRWKDETGYLEGESRFDDIKRERLAEPAFANRKVYIYVKIENGILELSVEDEGCGYEIKIRDKADGNAYGMGLMIIRNVTDNLWFNETGNRIYFCKKII